MSQPFNTNVSPRSPYTWGDLAKKIAKLTDEQKDHPIVVKLADMDSAHWFFATIHGTPENIYNDGVSTGDMLPPEEILTSTCLLYVHSDYHFSTELNDYTYFGIFTDP